jgi:general secretion pathway protein D
MKHLRIVLASILIMAINAPAYSNEAKAAYSRGVRAESQTQYDAAFEAYKEAYALKPKDAKYMAAYLRLRSSAAAEHVRKGQLLRDNLKLEEALVEFQRAAAIDSTNFAAQQEMSSTATMLKKQAQQAGVAPTPKPESPLSKMVEEAQGPVDLEPFTDTPLTLRMTTTADNIYKTIGKLAGINVLFDLDYKPQRINIELDDVPLREALRMVAMQSKTFWRPISTKAIFVAAEGRRKDFEDNVMTTFYLRNASTPSELQEVVSTLKGILDISRIQVNPTHGSITLRGTPDQMVLAQKLVSDIDKPKSEVVIDIAVLQVSRDRLRTMGTTVPTSTSIALAAAGGPGTVKLGSLNGSNFSIGVPGGSFTFLMSDSNTKVLQNPEIRVLDQGHATLKIGDRVPIATGSFSPGVGGGGINALVNTQFQYLDVGVNIDITPHIHSDHEVTLKMVLEVSSVTGQQNIGGISQPTIGQRRIEHETRLEDGEVNLVGGILEDSETQSLGGYPWLAKIPILKYLFAQENKDHREDEIVFAITPHIVRAEEITDENLRLIDIGTGNSVGLRRGESKKKAAISAPQPGKPAARGAARPQSPTTAPAAPTS